jgi:hypothetical protein
LAKWMPRAFIEKIWDAFWERWDKLARFASDSPRRRDIEPNSEGNVGGSERTAKAGESMESHHPSTSST